MNIVKKFRVKAVVSTVVQIMIVAILLPFIATLIGIMLKDSQFAQDSFLGQIFNMIPFSSEVQTAMMGAKLADPATNFWTIMNAATDAMISNATSGFYVGMWLHAFRIIFKEIIRMPGAPIVQTVVGLIFGAITLNMVKDGGVLPYLIIFFIMALNIVLTIIFVRKSVWQKVLDLALDMSMECFMTMFLSVYAMAICLAIRGYFGGMADTLLVILRSVLAWLIFLIVRYILLMDEK